MPASIHFSLPPPTPAFGWHDFTYWFERVWNFELVKVGPRHVVVNQLVFAVLILIVGLWLSRRLTGIVQRVLTSRTKLEESAAIAIPRILFYVLAVSVVLIALQVVSIPLTVFAFLGGAVAIGIGFGAQNIFNNFISGLILMIERPVRVGDLVEVDEYLGRVEDIRYRCTRIRRTDGIDVLVPNSKLLEQNVVNWTLRDRKVRASIQVGVVYGSDTALARDILREVATGHAETLADPEPIVIFHDFGDSALVFDVYFWADIRSMMHLRTISSDLRFEIDRRFREAGLVIAFPQRDVHLDTGSPLEVKLTGGAAPDDGAPDSKTAKE